MSVQLERPAIQAFQVGLARDTRWAIRPRLLPVLRDGAAAVVFAFDHDLVTRD